MAQQSRTKDRSAGAKNEAGRSGNAQTNRAESGSGSNQKMLIAVAAAVVAGLALVAFLATRGDGNGNEENGNEVVAAASVEVVGEPLPAMPDVGPIADSQNDAAVGLEAPAIIGTDFEGNEVRIEPDGRAKAIYFVAHWCPHCQAEVPVVQNLIDGGQKPENLDIYAVSTAVDSSRANYPPEDWLNPEDFSPSVIRDDAELTAYNSVGPAGFPYVVYLDANHQLVARSAGVLGEEQIQALWTSAAAG